MPRVAILGTRGYPSYYGGFETALRFLVPYLRDVGWNVDIYDRSRSASTRVQRLNSRVRVLHTPGIDSRSFSTLSYGFTSALDCAIRRPDVALVMNVANGLWLGALRVRGIPVVVNVDGLEWQRGKWGNVARGVFRLGAALTSRMAATLVCDSRAIRDRWLLQFGRQGMYIPYGGVPRTQLPVPYGLESGKYVLAVARFVPENSIGEFLDAVSRLREDIPVVLIGSESVEGPLSKRVRLLSDYRKNFVAPGRVADDNVLHALWQHAGVYFHGHTVGGTNPSLVQAMALGSPTIAADTVFNRETLGRAGRYTNLDPYSIAHSIEQVYDDPILRAEMAEESRRRARIEFTWTSVCQAYEGELRRVVGFGEGVRRR